MMRLVLITAFGLLTAPFLGGLIIGLDRILTARLQSRIGPPLFQPFYDLGKLWRKERALANPWQAFCAHCYLAAASIALALFGLQSDLLLILFVQAVGALFLVIGAFSSGSPYSQVGAHRELLQILMSPTASRSSISINGTNLFCYGCPFCFWSSLWY